MPASSRFRPHHLERSGDFTIHLPLGHVFPLFSPEGERAWVEGWDPEYLHPAHPSMEAGTVFRTTDHDEETLWLVLRYDTHGAVAEYGRFTAGSRLGTVLVHCHEEAAGVTRVSVRYALTALSPAGNAALADLTPAHYTRMLQEWRDAIVRTQAPPGATTDGT